VGQLQNVEVKETNIQYRLDDGTGVIDSKAFDLRSKPLQENDYVRVYGKLKEINSRKVFNVDHIHKLQDMNEISYHLLEATLVHLQAKGAPPVGANGGEAGYSEGMDTGMESGNYMQDRLRAFSGDAKRFYEYLTTAGQDNEGLNVHDIARALKMDLNKCTECSRQLCEAGLIYSTKDEETFAVLEGF
jgi:replication factor A2